MGRLDDLLLGILQSGSAKQNPDNTQTRVYSQQHSKALQTSQWIQSYPWSLCHARQLICKICARIHTHTKTYIASKLWTPISQLRESTVSRHPLSRLWPQKARAHTHTPTQRPVEVVSSFLLLHKDTLQIRFKWNQKADTKTKTTRVTEYQGRFNQLQGHIFHSFQPLFSSVKTEWNTDTKTQRVSEKQTHTQKPTSSVSSKNAFVFSFNFSFFCPSEIFWSRSKSPSALCLFASISIFMTAYAYQLHMLQYIHTHSTWERTSRRNKAKDSHQQSLCRSENVFVEVTTADTHTQEGNTQCDVVRL